MKLLVVATVLALAFAGCSGSGDAPADRRNTAPTSVAPTVPPDETVEADSRCPGGSLEGCYGFSEMQEYLAAITPMVGQFFQAGYPNVSSPRDIVLIPAGRLARTACGISDSSAFEYCGGDRTVYIGQDLLWQFYSRAGDAAPAVALAHEWGHHLQFVLGVSGLRATTRAQAIAFENQADCIAGAWAKYAGEQGWLEPGDDVEDALTLLQAIGSRESRYRDHGTSAEREAAFEKSYSGGIGACDAYFPDTPIA